MTQEIRVPDIGDFDTVEVIEICAAIGDQVGADDPLVVIESDKASMEIPAGVAGLVESISVKVGDQVSEGDLIAVLAAQDVGADKKSDTKDTKDTKDTTSEDGEFAEEAAPDEPEQTPLEHAQADEPAAVEVRVPDIGDAKDVVVIEVAVTEGDEVGADDLLVVVESDKASMEIPAGHAGRVSAVHVEVGSTVEEGSLLATLSTRAEEKTGQPPAKQQAKPAVPKEISASKAADSAGEAKTDRQSPPRVPDPEESSAEEPGESRKVYAGPAVRQLARELGVDLAEVKATGARNRIVKDDVKAFVKTALGRRDAAAAGAGIPRIPEIDFSKFGPIEKVALTKIRAIGAGNLHRSWLNIPHVTQFEEADVTELEEFRQSLKAEAQRRELKITPLAFIIKACCYALKIHPAFNSSLDGSAKNFILKKYYNIGFAVDTDQGLVVPVIRDADKLGIWELSAAIADLAEKARTAKLGMKDIQGGSFSVSSLGGIGGTGFTPIINAPEVAILGVSRLTTRPIWDGSKFEPRQMLPLSLSYDHRAINGAEAGRFMASLAELLADIRRLAL